MIDLGAFNTRQSAHPGRRPPHRPLPPATLGTGKRTAHTDCRR